MVITNVKIKNFRLLRDTSLSIEEKSTVIVGRNNSGKTSLTEVFRRLLNDKNPCFALEDFSIAAFEDFKEGLNKKLEGAEESEVRLIIPVIEIRISVSYDPAALDLGALTNFIIDLDAASTEALIVIKYQLANGKIEAFFEGLNAVSDQVDS